LVNRIASRYASATFTGFDHVLPHSITVGQILSDDIARLTTSLSSSDNAGLDNASSDNASIVPTDNNTLPTVFIMGGSQGSRTLYETFAELLRTNLLIATSFTFYITLGKLNDNLKPLFPQKNVHTFDFLTQKEMGELYQISDLCLARGGTTSLAEQKLFNIKSLIVPIPRTHDQMDNAKRYVHHYQDILLDQTSPTFFHDMEEAFLSLRSYKKPPLSKAIFSEIQQAKKLIIEELLR
jgi:UDP-N-acetylglucosamine:LPS N-acetylglucosamine transferase